MLAAQRFLPKLANLLTPFVELIELQTTFNWRIDVFFFWLVVNGNHTLFLVTDWVWLIPACVCSSKQNNKTCFYGANEILGILDIWQMWQTDDKWYRLHGLVYRRHQPHIRLSLAHLPIKLSAEEGEKYSECWKNGLQIAVNLFFSSKKNNCVFIEFYIEFYF